MVIKTFLDTEIKIFIFIIVLQKIGKIKSILFSDVIPIIILL